MKKLAALFLTLAMLFTLAIPALAAAPADDVEPPLWERLGCESFEDFLDRYWWDEEDYAYAVAYMKEHPEQVAQFRDNAYDYYDDSYRSYYYGSAEDYMALFDMTEEAFLTEMTVYQILDAQINEWYKTQWEQLCQEEPERTAQFLAELDDWFAEEYYWYDSVEDYCQSWYYSLEELYLTLYEEWNYDYAQQQLQYAYLREHGGIPGQVNVMVNGQCLSFPAGRPAYVEQGTTYADAAALSNALGVEVAADEAGYAPVRAAAEAAGCVVLWDNTFTAAVVIDTAALAERIDQDFTILNGVLSNLLKPLGTYQAGTDCTVDVTVFNSLDGDQEFQVSFRSDLVVSGDGLSGTVQYDAASLLPLLSGSESSAYYQQAVALLEPLLSATMEVRADLENGVLYYCIPSLNSILTSYGLDVPKNAWLSYPLETLEQDAWQEQALPVGALVCAMSLSDTSTAPGYLYDDIMDRAGRFFMVAGDSQFTRQGSSYVLEADPVLLFTLLNNNLSYHHYYWMYKELSLTLTVRDSGTTDFDLAFRAPNYSFYSSYGGSDVRIAASGSISAQAVSLDVEYHLQNHYKVAVTLKQSTSAAANEPTLTPPDGAPVVSLDELTGY